jgi:ABC-2 type transport system permease protein
MADVTTYAETPDHLPGAPRTPDASSPAKASRTPSVFGSICALMVRTQVTRTRILALGSLSVLALVVGASLGTNNVRNHLTTGTEFVNLYGLSLLVPVATLVFASSMFGDPSDDGTLVYLWLRPVARWKLTLAAALTSFAVTWPLVVPPLVAAAALTKGGSDLARATLLSATVMMFAYTGLYIALGLRVKRPLVWGLLYTFIWEGFVARGSSNAAKAAVRAYGTSILHEVTNVPLVLSDLSFAWGITVPIAAGVLGLLYAVRRLHRMDVA